MGCRTAYEGLWALGATDNGQHKTLLHALSRARIHHRPHPHIAHVHTRQTERPPSVPVLATSMNMRAALAARRSPPAALVQCRHETIPHTAILTPSTGPGSGPRPSPPLYLIIYLLLLWSEAFHPPSRLRHGLPVAAFYCPPLPGARMPSYSPPPSP